MSHSQKIFLVFATLSLIAGCSKQQTPPSTPLVEPRAADTTALPQEDLAREEFRGSFAPGGIEASYRATFSEAKIQTLEETRKATSQTGTYEFYGARLMKYRGAALGSTGDIELEFDQQGKVLVARAGDKEVSSEEISAIRDRAQSLRSHAIAQHAVQGHDKP